MGQKGRTGSIRSTTMTTKKKMTQREKLREELMRITTAHNVDSKQLKAFINYERAHGAAPDTDLSEHVKDGKVIFGVLDSTRLNSKYMRPDIYRTLYERFKQADVSYVFHTGDITDGHLRYSTHIDDIIYHNYHEMLQKLFNPKKPEGYPDIGVKTYFIGGNMDFTYFKKRIIRKIPTNVCKDIHNLRSDLDFLGWNGATISISPKTTVRLSHPLPGIGSKKPYAISYPLQLRANAFGAGQKPDILISGYFQKRFGFPFRGVEAQLIGSCISQTPIEAERNIPAPALCGVVFEVYFKKDGSLKELVTTDIPFYG